MRRMGFIKPIETKIYVYRTTEKERREKEGKGFFVFEMASKKSLIGTATWGRNALCKKNLVRFTKKK